MLNLGATVVPEPLALPHWHRRGFRLFWTWKSRRLQRRPYPGGTSRQHHVQPCVGGEPDAVPCWREAGGLDRARSADGRRPLRLIQHSIRDPSRGASPGRRRCRVGAPDGTLFVRDRFVPFVSGYVPSGELGTRGVASAAVLLFVSFTLAWIERFALTGSGGISDARRNHDWTSCGSEGLRSRIAPASSSARSRRVAPGAHPMIGSGE